MAFQNVRTVMTVLGFLCIFCSFLMRSCLSVTIVAMSDTNSTNASNHHTIPLTKTQQGLALGAYFWGYTVPQIPGGMLAERVGARIMLTLSVGLGGLLCMVTPILAVQHWVALVVARVLLGFSQGVLVPSIQAFYSRWIPPNEKSKAVSIGFMGTPVGIAVTFLISGVMCDTVGWESVFYLIGAVSVGYSVLFWFSAASQPSLHRKVTHAELDFIRRRQESRGECLDRSPIPWRSILTSLPVWSLIIAHIGQTYALYLSLTCLPMFLSDVIGFDIKSNGVYSAIPYLCNSVMCVLLSLYSDVFIVKGWIPRPVLRKGSTVLCGVGQSICSICACYFASETKWPAVLLMSVSVTFSAFQYPGSMCVFHDMSAQFAGSIYGLANVFGNITGIVVPSITAALTPNKTRTEWLNVFYLAAGVATVTTVQFAIFGSTTVQSWSNQDTPKIEREPANTDSETIVP